MTTAQTNDRRTSGLAQWIELQRIVDLKEASRLSGLSIDTIKRRHAGQIISLSPRRKGVRLADALMLHDVPRAR